MLPQAAGIITYSIRERTVHGDVGTIRVPAVPVPVLASTKGYHLFSISLSVYKSSYKKYVLTLARAPSVN